MKVCAVKKIDYEKMNKEGQKVRITGYEFHGTYTSNSSAVVVGNMLTDRQFVGDSAVDRSGGLPEEGQEIKFNFNRYGKVSDYEVVG